MSGCLNFPSVIYSLSFVVTLFNIVYIVECRQNIDQMKAKTPERPPDFELQNWDAISKDVPIKSYLLKKDIFPVSYDLILQINLAGFDAAVSEDEHMTFNGTVTIELEVKNKTNVIELNQNGLTIDKTGCVLQINNKTVGISLVSQVDIFEKLVIVSSSDIKVKDKVQIIIPYKGRGQRKAQLGPYESFYLNKTTNRNVSAFALTLESDFARMIVPCFDEPEFKATWKAEIIHPKGTSALFNTKEIETKSEPGRDYLRTSFKRTDYKMSSYLLSIIVSDFHYVEKVSKSGVRFRVYASHQHNPSQLDYALNAGIKICDFIEKTFNTKYQQDKMDFVALEMFMAGALENWGLIPYQHHALVEKSDGSNRQTIASTIAHEMIHQWFGNQVTLKFWDEVFVNEGFAKLFMSMSSVVTQEPLFNILTVTRIVESNLLLTALRKGSAPSLNSRIVKRSEVRDHKLRFNPLISYDKGGALFYTIWKIMESNPSYSQNDTFIKTLSEFLENFKYKNANSTDVFNATIGKVPGYRGFFDDWVYEEGYPVLEAFRENGTHIAVKLKKDHNCQVNVPVFVRKNDEVPYQIYRLHAGETVYIESTPAEKISINPERIALTRVEYSNELFNELWSKETNLNNDIMIHDARLSGNQNYSFNSAIFMEYHLKPNSSNSWRMLGMSSSAKHLTADEASQLLELYKKVLNEIETTQNGSEYSERNTIVKALACWFSKSLCDEKSTLKIARAVETKNEEESLSTITSICYHAAKEKTEKLKMELMSANISNLPSTVDKIACSNDRNFIKQTVTHLLKMFKRTGSAEIPRLLKRMTNFANGNQVLQELVEQKNNKIPLKIAREIRKSRIE